MFPRSYSHRWWGRLWQSTASCIHLMNKRVFCNLQCQMHSLRSCLHLPSEKWSLLAFQREVNRSGQMNYSLCFQYRVSLIVQLVTLLCFTFVWPLCKAVYCIWCVYFLKKYIDDYIRVLLVPLSGSVGWTCLCATIFFSAQGFSCSAPGHEDPLETLPSTLEGHYTSTVYYTHFSFTQ